MKQITMGQAQWRAESDSGESLSFELCRGGYFSDRDEYGLKVVGKTAQDGTPTLNAPIPIQCVKAGTKIQLVGENLCPSMGSSTKSNGITFTKLDDGIVIIDGTATNNAYYHFYITADTVPFPSGVPITLSGCPNGGAANHYRLSFQHDSPNGGMFNQYYDYGQGVSFSIPSGATITRVWMTIYKDVTVNNLIVRPQITIGNEVRAFTPYISGGEITVPCNLYEGDVWYPMSGKVERHRRVISGAEINTANYIYNSVDGTCNCVYADASDRHKGFREVYSSHHHLSNGQQGRNMTLGECIGADNNSPIWYTVPNELNTINKITEWAISENLTFVYKLEIPIIEQNDEWIQPIFAPRGTVNVLQAPTELTAELGATVLTRRKNNVR